MAGCVQMRIYLTLADSHGLHNSPVNRNAYCRACSQ
jgi:hypothetical protein